MKLCVLLLTIALSMAYSDVLIYDDFEDGMADGWLEMPGANYQVESGRYHFQHSSQDTVMAASLTGDVFGSMSVPSYSIRTEIEIEEGQLAGTLARFDLMEIDGYALTLLTDAGGIMALSRIDGGTIELLSYTFTPISTQKPYWVRFEINGSLMGGKIWTGSTSQEPAYWNLTALDSTYMDPGSVGLIAYDESRGTDAALEAWFDEFMVEDELTLDLPSTTWGSIKACEF